MTNLQFVLSNIFLVKDLSPSGMSGWATSQVRMGLPNHHPSTLFGTSWDILYPICQDGADCSLSFSIEKLRRPRPKGFESLFGLCLNCLTYGCCSVCQIIASFLLSILFPSPKEPSSVSLPLVNLNLVTNKVKVGLPLFCLKLFCL